MTVEEAIALRKRMLLSQGALAERMGMTERAWQDIENGRAKLRTIHVLALERVALDLAAAAGLVNVLPEQVLHDAVAIVLDKVREMKAGAEPCERFLLGLTEPFDKQAEA